MTETGGATTQAGIYYQNSVAALQLADLLDLRTVPARERIVGVRVEAPSDVDDIVVEYADGHRHFLSAKLRLNTGGKAWENLWSDLYAEATAKTTRQGDRLSIVVSKSTGSSDAIAALCTLAATSVDAGEFDGRVTDGQRAVLDQIAPDKIGIAGKFELLRRVEVIVLSESNIEREFAARRSDTANATPTTLLALLRDLAGGFARSRRSFRAPALRQQLLEENDVVILEPADWGVDAYRDAIRRAARIEIPGTGFSGPADDVILWPRVRDWEQTGHSDFEDELPREQVDLNEGQIDLSRFPSEGLHRCVLVAGPGHGKSALLSAIAAGLAEGPIVPILIPLASLAASGSTIMDFLAEHTNRDFDVKIDWRRLAEQGLTALLLDGLDEVPGPARVPLLDKLRTFSARYPKVPWLLTVRDPAVLPGANDARTLEILPLSDRDIARFAEKMAKHGLAIDGENLVYRLRSYPDLQRLARIPLFLALMIATMEPKRGLPKSRSDLIERYLQTLFAPHEHKPVEAPVVSPGRLRAISARLAFIRLEAGEIGASEREIVAAAVSAQGISPEGTDQLIAALVANGIVRRQSSIRFQFPFPIVQEYLAATYLIDHQPDTLAGRINDAIQRPWAQVLQFALELHPAPSPIITDMLGRPDDAFATGLRLVARCIANGAKVEEAQVAEVTDRLIAYWTRAHFDARSKVGQLVFDAFSSPISPTLWKALHNYWLLNDHGAQIIAREASATLSMSVLNSLLRREVREHNFYHGLKVPFSALGDAGFDRIMAVASEVDLTENEWSGLDDLLTHFVTGSVTREKAKAAVENSNLPIEVRLNCARIAGGPFPAEIWTLVVQAIASGEVYNWRTADLLEQVDDREERYFAILCNSSIPFDKRFDLATYISRVFQSDEKRAQAIERLISDPKIDPELAVVGRVLAARNGDGGAFESLIEEIPSLSAKIVRELLSLFGRHPGRKLAARAADLIQQRSMTANDVVSFADAADIGMHYIYETDYGFGGALRDTVPHAGTPVWADLFERWLERSDLSVSQRMDVAINAAKLGSDRGRQVLTAMVLEIANPDDPQYDDGAGYGQTMRAAVSEVRRSLGQIPLDLAERLARAKRPNVPYAGIAAIEAHGDRLALDLLLRLFHETRDWSKRSMIEGAIERLASKLAVFVRRNGQNLDIV